jgi:hypothetical protein
VKIGEEEVVEVAVECRRALFIYAKFLLHLCKRIDRNTSRILSLRKRYLG